MTHNAARGPRLRAPALPTTKPYLGLVDTAFLLFLLLPTLLLLLLLLVLLLFLVSSLATTGDGSEQQPKRGQKDSDSTPHFSPFAEDSGPFVAFPHYPLCKQSRASGRGSKGLRPYPTKGQEISTVRRMLSLSGLCRVGALSLRGRADNSFPKLLHFPHG